MRAPVRAVDEPGERPGARVEALEHELALSRAIRKRLGAEVGRAEARATTLETEVGSLRGVLAERERYIAAIEASVVWRLAQALRRLAGRAW